VKSKFAVSLYDLACKKCEMYKNVQRTSLAFKPKSLFQDFIIFLGLNLRPFMFFTSTVASQSSCFLYRVDWNGRQCTAFTAADTDKKQNDNTRQLTHRGHDLYERKAALQHGISLMTDEVNALLAQRQRLKMAMGVLRMPESIAQECLDRRTARLEPDLARDKAEEELIKVLFNVFE